MVGSLTKTKRQTDERWKKAKRNIRRNNNFRALSTNRLPYNLGRKRKATKWISYPVLKTGGRLYTCMVSSKQDVQEELSDLKHRTECSPTKKEKFHVLRERIRPWKLKHCFF